MVCFARLDIGDILSGVATGREIILARRDVRPYVGCRLDSGQEARASGPSADQLAKRWSRP